MLRLLAKSLLLLLTDGVFECDRLVSARGSGKRSPGYCSFEYSTLASFRIGISGSASFQRAKKSL
jgi:hypothetical protein